ncbi:VOC family protein [Streptomyces sp. AHA2]|uniref:VOC family protein n=1 Tax=Streptomyces sp. AHA2 TaxID=3064526 RepID=UPI002FE26B65
MAVQPEGTPCWADAMSSDLEGAESFYGEVLGWTFAQARSEFGDRTEAYADGRAVAAVVPPVPGQEGRSPWCLYFAAEDAVATAERIRAHGGEILTGPVRVVDLGSMCLARDPGGVVFGLWQAGTHEGFQAVAEPGAYTWAEIFTRDPATSDAFFSSVFSYRQRHMEDEEGDFRIYDLGERTVLGRMEMGEEFPPEVRPHINVYFGVGDCDEAVARAVGLGGELRFGPMTTPFGRFAAIGDPQGASFSVIDTGTTEGEMPELTDVS